MGVKDTLMRIAFKVKDAVALVKQFEESPAEAMQEVIGQMRSAFRSTLERLMDTEIELFLGSQKGNKRNGYVERTYGVKGVGEFSAPGEAWGGETMR
jgi:hypothetical protein